MPNDPIDQKKEKQSEKCRCGVRRQERAGEPFTMIGFKCSQNVMGRDGMLKKSIECKKKSENGNRV